MYKSPNTDPEKETTHAKVNNSKNKNARIITSIGLLQRFDRTNVQESLLHSCCVSAANAVHFNSCKNA